MTIDPQTRRSAGPLALETPLQYLKGVGPARAKALAKLGLVAVGDLLWHLPRSHEDRRLGPPALWGPPGTPVARAGVVSHYETASAGKNLVIGRALIAGDGPPFEALWFRRRSYRYDALAPLEKKLTPGARVAVYGPWQRGPRGPEIRVEDHTFPTGETSPHMDRWVPVYDLTAGVDGALLRRLVWSALEVVDRVEDPLPESLRAAWGFPGLAAALRDYHFPVDPARRAAARRRLAFDEFFMLELALARARERRRRGPPSPVCAANRSLLSPFRARLGFDFTPAQKKVINEIFDDMGRPEPMNRLLMGDVGSGKTVVAVAALLLAVESGHQAALLAPTEILAEQHALGLSRWLEGLGVRWALLRGGGSPSQKKKDKAALAAGEIQIAIGTHALLEGDVAFKDLGVAVIDEQHRFGVAQRAALGAKGRSPHTLLMTATPIPRTLAMTVYGDLSVSVIVGRPPGRGPVRTARATEGEAWAAVSRALAAGRQAYVVFPLIEESEKSDLRAVVEGWNRLRALFPDRAVGLLHGRMKSEEKARAMADFSAGRLHVLAATPVIEVGIDVPNATALVVMNAERFGLAQLHQLRGRVGRGAHASDCLLVSRAGGDAAERLALLCRTNDGFVLAEEDLKRRGPGEVLGEAQHGLPDFRAGHLVTDGPLIEEARARAFALLAEDPGLARAENAVLAAHLQRRFGARWHLGRVA
ncbi:MAG: ATP-dependent DNA helicase RecG [Elusimicrobia bacterium]|nr:ATP-dependent DNA helicase RecG [Elusimicrobiota bacterium]MBK8423437.1 ATP-dependent DNA helicase RecG [Elusimicrobiota bacterium]